MAECGMNGSVCSWNSSFDCRDATPKVVPGTHAWCYCGNRHRRFGVGSWSLGARRRGTVCTLAEWITRNDEHPGVASKPDVIRFPRITLFRKEFQKLCGVHVIGIVTPRGTLPGTFVCERT